MKLYLSNPARRKELFLFVIDGLLVFAVFVFAYFVKIVLYQGADFHDVGERVSWLVFIAVVAHWLSFYLFELYDISTKRSHLTLITLVIISVLVASGILSIMSYLLPQDKLGRAVLSIHIPVTIAVIYSWRLLFTAVVVKTFKLKNVITVGSLNVRDKTNELIGQHAKDEYRLLGCITAYDDTTGTVSVDGNVAGQDIEQYVNKNDIGTIIIDENAEHPRALQKKLIDLKFEGIEIYDYPTFYSKLTARIPVMHVSNEWVLFAKQEKTFQPTIYVRLKQFLDVILALIGLSLALPFFLVIIPVIRLTSRGPVFFKQERLGLNGKPFTLIKFRTMIHDAEQNTGPVWSRKNDPRITKVGRFLRMTRLDELPQLINILKGEMSFVGPRPIRKHFADKLGEQFPFYRLRFVVKPGVTGWAQVNCDYAGSEKGQLTKLEYELFYIRNQSIILDLFIILKTISTVLFRRGE
jgi:exopolysaccharide biosynthesis polyprenyl glycosylphosphotransferase